MSVLLSILWILFSVFHSAQSQSFTSPVTTGIYPVNETVPVTVVFSSDAGYVDASMTCGSTTSTIVRLTKSVSRTTILPPNNYFGSCTVNGKTQDNDSLTPVTIKITGTISITSPSTTSPLTKYPAGSSLPVSWTYAPSSGSTTAVNLTCTPSGTSTSTLSLVASSPVNLTINSNSYGSNCTLSLVSSNSSYILSSPVFLTVSQQLSLVSPISGYSYPLATGTIPLRLNTSPYISISELVPVVLTCDLSSSSSSVTTNSAMNYVIPSGYSGPCTLTPVPGPAQDYLVAPSSAMSFYLKYNLAFSPFTSIPVAGSPFSFQLNTSPSRAVSQTVIVSLICNGTANQTWTSVPVNTLYSTTLNSDVPTGVLCALQTSAASEYFYQVTSSSAAIRPSTQTFTITSPSAGAKLASGSSFNVTWTTSSNPQAGTIYNASLYCTGFSTLDSTTTLFTTSISIPSTYFGDSCAVSVAATGFSTAQVSVVVTQILSFETPTDGSLIALTTSSFPLKLITSGANIYANIPVSFQCDGGSFTTTVFAANTDSLTRSVSSSQIGPCSLIIIAAPPYLVYPYPSVSFSLKYSLTFTTLPTIIYRGQSFTIQINTATPASAPPSVTLFLVCTSEVVSDTWTNVLINQPSSLVLSSDAPLGSCYFKVNSDATYTQATSSYVTVSKVPVTVYLPSGPGPFPKPLAFPLLVNTTVTPVNGTVNLRSTCSSLITPFAVSIPINTLGSFSYPQNAYGTCNLAVVDEVFS